MRLRNNYGFSLIELAVVVAIIGILAALALPAYELIKQRSRLSTFENDIRQYEQVFDAYALEVGEYPATQHTAGVIPVGMEGRISSTWKLPSVIGGDYRWIYTTGADPDLRSAYIEVVGTAENPILIESKYLLKLDKELDDGNSSTGRIRISGSNIQIYMKQ